MLALDIQPRAVAATNERLAAAGLEGVGHAIQADHARLGELAEAGSADCVLFNFGWLPGGGPRSALHGGGQRDGAESRAGAAQAPGLSWPPCSTAGRSSGTAEKQAALAFFRSLPLTEYTVLVCEFANWADTAPLPCFILKRMKGGPRPVEEQQFLEQYMASFNGQQQAAVGAVEGPVLLLAVHGQRQDHRAGDPAGVYGALPGHCAGVHPDHDLHGGRHPGDAAAGLRPGSGRPWPGGCSSAPSTGCRR